MAKRRRKDPWRTMAAWLVLLALAGIGYRIVRNYIDLHDDNDTTFVRYDAFGIDMPTDYKIHGIDVSRYQKKVNWTLVKQMQVNDIKIGFCFIKATEGIALVDDMFKRNWRKSREAGIIRGAYHFFNPNKDGKAQAANFIANVELQKGDLPPVLDVESLGNATVSELKQHVKDWLQAVEQAYGVRPIIYSGVDFYSKYLGEDLNEYPYWAAHYQQQSQPAIRRSWSIWQHNDNGRVNGIATAVDFNAFNGDSADLKRMLVQ